MTTYYREWKVLDAQPVVVDQKQPLGVRRIAAFSAVGFVIFVTFAAIYFATESDIAFIVASIGGLLWVILGSSFRKNVLKLPG